jgi:hypothetical protein
MYFVNLISDRKCTGEPILKTTLAESLWVYLKPPENITSSKEYILVDAVSREQLGGCTACEELDWPPLPNARGRTLDLTPLRRNRDHSDWYECEVYLNNIFPPREYRAVSMLPQLVLPAFPSSVEASDTQHKPTGRIESPPGQSTQLSQFIHNSPNVPQFASSKDGDASQAAPGIQPTRNLPGLGNPGFTPAVSFPPSNVPFAAAVTLGDLSVTAIKAPGYTGVVQFASTYLTLGGPVYTTAGHTFSLASSGLAIDGTSIVPLTRPNPTPPAVLFGISDFSTAKESPGIVFFGSTALSVGGPAHIVDGHTISLAAGGVVLDATTIVPLTEISSSVRADDPSHSASSKSPSGRKSGGPTTRDPSFYLLPFILLMLGSCILIL